VVREKPVNKEQKMAVNRPIEKIVKEQGEKLWKITKE
jgi:hypothetical protein